MKFPSAVRCPQRLNHADFCKPLTFSPVPQEEVDICGSEQSGSTTTGFTGIKFPANILCFVLLLTLYFAPQAGWHF